VVDWKKEIKLSDLVGKKTHVEAEAVEPEVLEPQVVEPQLIVVQDTQPIELITLVPAPVVEESPEPIQFAVLPVAPPAVPVVVHPPVPAAELPPVAEAEAGPAKPKVPFWKREIGGSKKPKAEQPKPAKAAKQKAEKTPKVKGERRLKLERPTRAPKTHRTKDGKVAKRQKRLVGVKVGASQIAAAHVSNNGHSELLQVARTPLEPGIVSGGELREPDALAEALKIFFKQHKLPKRGVRLGIANNRIGVRTFEIVGIEDPKQLTNAIRFRAQEALPIPIEEAVLDYQVLSETRGEDGQTTRRILLVVAYRELIDRYVSAFRKAGIQLAGIDLEAFALLRALGGQPAEGEARSDAAVVAVSVGSERTTFAVSDGRTCEFTRVLDWGGSTLTVAIARVLDLAPSEAEPIKHQLSLFEAAAPPGLTEEQASAARDAMRKQVQSFARELVSSLQFYQNQPGSLGIGEIVISGGTAHLPGLAEELQQLIGVGVRVGDPLARVQPATKLGDLDQVGSLAVAIGLGIED
jgi:type IV pilus assembly protein PilM